MYKPTVNTVMYINCTLYSYLCKEILSTDTTVVVYYYHLHRHIGTTDGNLISVLATIGTFIITPSLPI